MTQDEFGSIYQTGFDRTVRLLRCRGASFDQAEDISQSAWAQGWRKIDQLRDHRLLMGWINTIAINLHRAKGSTTLASKRFLDLKRVLRSAWTPHRWISRKSCKRAALPTAGSSSNNWAVSAQRKSRKITGFRPSPSGSACSAPAATFELRWQVRRLPGSRRPPEVTVSRHMTVCGQSS